MKKRGITRPRGSGSGVFGRMGECMRARVRCIDENERSTPETNEEGEKRTTEDAFSGRDRGAEVTRGVMYAATVTHRDE